MVRKFLYVIAALIALVIIAAIAFRLNPLFFMRLAMVPTTAFVTPAPLAGYNDPALWIARPGQPGAGPTGWRPRATGVGARIPAAAPRGNAAIFYVHPTSHLSRSGWNAALNDAEANGRAVQFTRMGASLFGDAGDIWAPRYRQAAIGAFLTEDRATAERALDAAYADVSAAFDQFLAEAGPDRPIILAGHSQGALHLTRLLRDRVAGRPLAQRIVAAYIVGWPVSVQHDLPAMGLSACAAADSVRCVLSWQTFGEPAEPSAVVDAFDAGTGFDGQSRRGSAMLCVNPLTGTAGGNAPASANLGAVRYDADYADGEVAGAGYAPAARCDGARGLLLIGQGPDVGAYLMPGNNYHVFDYPLFWMNVRADALRRLAAWQGS